MFNPSRPTEEARLLAGLRRQAPWAQEALFTQHAESVLGWCIRLGGNGVDAEDLAQEVFITAFRSAKKFRGDSRVRTWLFGITRGLAANARRRAALREVVSLSSINEPRTHGLEDALHLRDERRRVLSLLDQLPTKHREALVLCDLEGRSAPEVAELLGTKPGTVYSRLHNARRQLHQLTRPLVNEAPLLVAKGGR